jgi:hypothetical protein
MTKSEKLASLDHLESEIDNALLAIEDILSLMNKYNANSSNNGLKISFTAPNANDFPELPKEAQTIKNKLRTLRNLYARTFPEEFASLDSSTIRNFMCLNIGALLYSTDLHTNLHTVRDNLTDRVLDIKRKRFDIIGDGLDSILYRKANNVFSLKSYDRQLDSKTKESDLKEDFNEKQRSKDELREEKMDDLSKDKSYRESIAKASSNRGDGSLDINTNNSSFNSEPSSNLNLRLGSLFGIEIGPIATPIQLMDLVTQSIIQAQNPSNVPFCDADTEKEFQNSFSEEMIESRKGVVGKKEESSNMVNSLEGAKVESIGLEYSKNQSYLNRLKDIEKNMLSLGPEKESLFRSDLVYIQKRIVLAETRDKVRSLLVELTHLERKIKAG